MSCDPSPAVLRVSQIVTVLFLSPPPFLQTYQGKFCAGGAEGLVILDGDGVGDRAALYKFHLLILHFRHQGCSTDSSLLWEVLPVSPAQGTCRST